MKMKEYNSSSTWDKIETQLYKNKKNDFNYYGFKIPIKTIKDNKLKWIATDDDGDIKGLQTEPYFNRLCGMWQERRGTDEPFRFPVVLFARSRSGRIRDCSISLKEIPIC